MSDVDAVEIQIGIAQGRKSFSILEATALWCELDTRDQRIKRWVKAVCEPGRSPIDVSIIHSPFLPSMDTQRLRDLSIKIDLIDFEQKVETDKEMLNKLASDSFALKDQAKEIINAIRPSEAFKRHLAMHETVVSLVWNMIEICGGGRTDLEKPITRDQLEDLANIRKEHPRFLGIVDEQVIHPKTRNVWRKLIAAFCLEAGFNPREKGVVDAITKMTEKHGLAIPRATIAKVIKEIKEQEILP